MSKFKITYTLEAENLNDAMNVAHLLLLKDGDADISQVKVTPAGAHRIIPVNIPMRGPVRRCAPG